MQIHVYKVFDGETHALVIPGSRARMPPLVVKAAGKAALLGELRTVIDKVQRAEVWAPPDMGTPIA